MKNLNSLFKAGVIILLGVLFFVSKQCSENKSLVEDIKKLKEYEKEAKFYKGKNGEVIAYNNTLEVSIKSLEIERKGLMDSIKSMRIKKPQVIVTTRTEVVVDSIYIAFTDSIPCEPFVTSFMYQDTVWLSINGRVSNRGVFIDNIYMENQVLTVVGTKRNGLFKRNESIVAISNTNPYVNVSTIEPLIIKQKPVFYDRLWFKGFLFVGGVAAGIAISR